MPHSPKSTAVEKPAATPRHWDAERGRLVAGDAPYEPRLSPSRMAWYTAALAAARAAPSPAALAAALARLGGDAPRDLDALATRLAAWPDGQPYVPFPDDAALAMRVHRRADFDARAYPAAASPAGGDDAAPRG